jgi:hypothetical protein
MIDNHPVRLIAPLTRRRQGSGRSLVEFHAIHGRSNASRDRMMLLLPSRVHCRPCAEAVAAPAGMPV